METQSVLVVPGEDDEMVVHASTQGPSFIQQYISQLLKLPQHKIISDVKRVGGGFGGKVTDSKCVVGVAAVAAWKYKKPVQCVLNRHEDIIATGKRHPVCGTFNVGFDKTGRLGAVEINGYLDGGHRMGTTIMIGFNVCNNTDCVYDIPAGKVSITPVRTHTCSNTAFRGAGNPQSNFLMDQVMQNVAMHLELPPHKVSVDIVW